MIKKIGIVGGDLRIIRLTQILAKDDYSIYTYGLEKYIFKEENIIKCSSIEEICNNCNSIISGVPFSKDGKYIDTPFSYENIDINNFIRNLNDKTLIAGAIENTQEEILNSNNCTIIDLLKIEELTVLNVIPTIEGALQVAINETEISLNSSKCLILGFGRIGKLLSKSLKSLGADVYCVARKESDIAWIKAYGFNPIHLSSLDSYLSKKYDLYAVSNWFTKTQSIRLEKMGVLKYFKKIYGADINYYKPDKRVFDDILKDYNKEDCISIGDSLKNDVELPISLGMNALWKTKEKSSKYQTFDDLTELMQLL